MPLSKRNRRGLIWLLILCVTIAFSPRVLNGMYSVEHPVITMEEAVKLHREYVKKEKNKTNYRKKKRASKFKKPDKKFDPNTYTKEDWLKLGLSEKQSDVVIKFSSRGLKSNDDVKKIFVIPDELYELIKDSLFYRDIVTDQKHKPWENKIEVKVNVDLNGADQVELETIPGIGKYFASKIIEYRSKLGGFTGKEQLLEIWNFDEEKYKEIEGFVFLETSEISKININSATYEQLKNHPYISYSVANSIVKMRDQQSGYKEISDIKQSKLIDIELYNKLLPYLTL